MFDKTEYTDIILIVLIMNMISMFMYDIKLGHTNKINNMHIDRLPHEVSTLS